MWLLRSSYMMRLYGYGPYVYGMRDQYYNLAP